VRDNQYKAAKDYWHLVIFIFVGLTSFRIYANNIHESAVLFLRTSNKKRKFNHVNLYHF
jgi:hypothetical protein